MIDSKERTLVSRITVVMSHLGKPKKTPMDPPHSKNSYTGYF